MFGLFVLIWAVIIYIMVPIMLIISGCYWIAYFIGSIPDIWFSIKTWWKERFSS